MSTIQAQTPRSTGLLVHWSIFNVNALLLASLFLSFSFAVWILALAKGIPVPDATNKQNQQQQPPAHLRQRTQVSGSPSSKAFRSLSALAVAIACNYTVYLCMDTLSPRYGDKSSLGMPLFMALATFVLMNGGFWTLSSAGCALELIVEAFLERDFDSDVFILPSSFLAHLWTTMMWRVILVTDLIS
ncbi:uncharacterized protein PAC_02595 [Phialocephala subalpina]|uniref:Uncharacterized protein n=1 Tax=Phialocephala subalpina TaxID=576137 RepID=A0A1L7WJ08_9HELO|nr:uncharacterized protein PAC_02595 [Phialocephala subalpina]